MNISKMDKKIDKIILVFQIAAFDKVAADSNYYKENTCHSQSIAVCFAAIWDTNPLIPFFHMKT